MRILNILLEQCLIPVGDLFFGSKFGDELKRIRRLSWLTEDDIRAYQSERIRTILQIASLKSDYYKSLKIQPSSDPIEWLKKFPILEKSILRKNTDSLLTTSKDNLIRNFTSGSTGLQTMVYVTKREQSKYRAAQTAWWEWAGYYPGYPTLQTGLATSRSLEKRLKDFFFRTYYLFAFGLEQGEVNKAFEWARKRNPVLGGYASSLFVLAEMSESSTPLKFKSAISWGDKLFDHYRKKIEKQFGCKVYETYGAGEGLMIGAQKDLDYMYIMSPCVYLEILDAEGNEVRDGELGYVVVTSLLAEAMPLIRYKLGDLAVKLPREKYPANRALNLPLLEKVIGRETDLVHTPSGKKMIVHSFTGIFEYYPQIRQFCVIQRSLDGIIIQFIRGDNYYPGVLIEIEARIRSLLNEPFSIVMEEVVEILPTRSGKPQIIMSELNFSGIKRTDSHFTNSQSLN